jgi:hypothetical protein
MMSRELTARRAVEDGFGNMIRVGDTVRHQRFGRDAVVTATYTAVQSGVRYDEIAVDQGAPWDPKDVRKL